MGIVYLATDPTIGRSVAIKTVRLRDVDNAQQREKLRERLFREARSAGALSHHNIVTIYDMAEQDGLAYIAMEYVDGPTLDLLMSSSKSLETGKLFDILRQTATALDFAHTKGVIHRDVKPANIMLGRDGVVKVTDFGIAKINAAAESFTMTGTLVGTPNYMSPEQVQGTEVTGRSDQFSLAVIAYEILTGELPFPGEQLSTVVYKIVAEEPVVPHRLNSTLGSSIDAVLRKGLAKKAASRYRTCAEFVGSLETSCAATKGWQPRVRGASLNMSTMSGALPIPLPAPMASASPPAENGKRAADRDGSESRRSRLLPLAAALLVVAGLFTLLTWHGGEKTSANPVEPKQETPVPAAPPPATDPAAKPVTAAADDHVESAPPAAGSESPPAATETSAAKPSADSPDVATPPPTAAAKPAKVTKPSAMRADDRDDFLPEPAPRSSSRSQDLAVATNPPGANASIDGGGASCVTPCTLPVSPGMHSLSIRLDGFQEERREIHVGGEAEDIPLISLRRAAGTLMITTVPPGATITINDKVQSQTTPAQINLPPGTYNVMVEKNGKRAVDRVEIRNGNTNFIKIPLE